MIILSISTSYCPNESIEELKDSKNGNWEINMAIFYDRQCIWPVLARNRIPSFSRCCHESQI